MRLPCEIDQAKLDRISRLACSTNLSKILAAFRLSGAVLDRGPDLRQGVLELVAPANSALDFYVQPRSSAFLRELFKTIGVLLHCQADSFCSLQPLQLTVGGDSGRAIHQPGRFNPSQKIAQRKISKIDQRATSAA